MSEKNDIAEIDVIIDLICTDATPQESSEGIYRVGPTSVEAIKFGEINKPYDGFFVYAEVNADEVYWLYRDDKKPLKLITHSTDT